MATAPRRERWEARASPGRATRLDRGACVRFVATAAASAARVHAPGRGARGGLLGGAGLRERSPWSASRAPPEELNRAGNSAANSACNSDFGSTQRTNRWSSAARRGLREGANDCPSSAPDLVWRFRSHTARAPHPQRDRSQRARWRTSAPTTSSRWCTSTS
jgi:hypothetical protein